MLAERWRVHYNTVRPHFSLSYKPPAPEAWQTEIKTGCGDIYPARCATLPISLAQKIGQSIATCEPTHGEPQLQLHDSLP